MGLSKEEKEQLEKDKKDYEAKMDYAIEHGQAKSYQDNEKKWKEANEKLEQDKGKEKEEKEADVEKEK